VTHLIEAQLINDQDNVQIRAAKVSDDFGLADALQQTERIVYSPRSVLSDGCAIGHGHHPVLIRAIAASSSCFASTSSNIT
jgi:hypothetical protein